MKTKIKTTIDHKHADARSILSEMQSKAYEIKACARAVFHLLGEPCESTEEQAANTLLVMIETHADYLAEMADVVSIDTIQKEVTHG